jgi:hypothetical protein
MKKGATRSGPTTRPPIDPRSRDLSSPLFPLLITIEFLNLSAPSGQEYGLSMPVPVGKDTEQFPLAHRRR